MYSFASDSWVWWYGDLRPWHESNLWSQVGIRGRVQGSTFTSLWHCEQLLWAACGTAAGESEGMQKPWGGSCSYTWWALLVMRCVTSRHKTPRNHLTRVDSKTTHFNDTGRLRHPPLWLSDPRLWRPRFATTGTSGVVSDWSTETRKRKASF